jgi:hypothetical protein
VATRVVQLDLTGEAGGDGRRSLGVRIFHLDIIYWIRTRVVPGVSLKGLLQHLVDEIAAREIAELPFNLFHYNIFDLSREMHLLPALTVEDIAGPILYVHETEFLNAFDRTRRLELVAHAVKQIEKQLPPELVSQSAPPELRVVSQASRANTSDEPAVLPIRTPEHRPAPATTPRDDRPTSGWATWHRMVG